MTSEVISVIIPIYNVEQYLEILLDSVVNQTYSLLDIILVDDGSTDKSGTICDLYARKDKRIRVIHQTNQGVSVARNSGLEIVKGEYIVFVDSDDIIDSHYVEILYETAKKYHVKIVQCDSKKFIEEPNRVEPVIGDVEIISARDANLRIYKSNTIIYTVLWCKIFKRELFEKVRFPIGKTNEDTFTTYKLFYLADSIAVIPFVGYYYRIRRGSIMHANVSMNSLYLLEAYRERQNYYASIKDDELFKLCLDMKVHAGMSLFGKACWCKSSKGVRSLIWADTKKSLEERAYSKKNMLEESIFVTSPLLYGFFWGIANLLNTIIRKLNSIVKHR